MLMVLIAAAAQQRRCCGAGVQAFLAPAAVAVHRSASLSSSISSTLLTVLTVSNKPNTKLSAFATADAEDIQRARNNDEDDSSSSSWTPVQGGFLPRFRTPKSAVPLVREIRTLEEYRQYVVQPHDTITVVRFYAPWCRACKAVQPKFQRISRQYASAAAVASEHDKTNHRSSQSVQFVEVPLTAETAVLHSGLGVPSLPYGHIYSNGLLVEERKMNKHVFAEFEAVLQTYVQGSCPVQYNHDTGVVEWLRE